MLPLRVAQDSPASASELTEITMRKIILMAIAGFLWKKYKAPRATTPAARPPAARY